MFRTVRFIRPFSTLRGHLTLLASIATLPAFLFVVYIAGSERKAAVQKAESEARYAADLAAREHAHQIAGAQRLLERLALIAAGAGDTTQLRAMLPPILSGFPQVANIGVLDPAGNVIYSVVPIRRPVEMRDEPAFAEALRSSGVAVGQYRVGKIVGRPVLILANAIRDDTSRPRMVLFAALELAWLDQLARQADLPRDTALAIADRRGTVLAASTNVQSRIRSQPPRIDRFDELTRLRSGTVRVRGIDGVQRLAVAAPLRGVKGFWVIVGSPEEKIQSIANRIFFRDVAVLALFAVFAIGASIFAADLSVLRDLRLLARATRRFGEGDLTARSPVPSARGEIREVTTAFNAMASALELRDREATESRETLRALTHRLQTVREDEARRIAQELHDELGQDLTVLKIELDNIRRRCERELPALVQAVDGMDQTIDQALHSVRRISSELRPGVLDRLGLEAGLEWLLREVERRSSLAIELHAAGLDETIESETATALFRITQEALTNIVRHANASSVAVDVAATEEQVVLTIRDDGSGFDPRSVRTTALGLVGMRERAARLGGSVRIDSRPGGGTELTTVIPRGETHVSNPDRR